MEANRERSRQAEIEGILSFLIMIARLARLGPTDDELREYIEASSRVDTFVPMIDPSLWLKGAKNNECFLKMARGLQAFRAALPTMTGNRFTDYPRAIYPKTADYPDLPFEAVVVERGADGDVVHVEVCSRHSLESEARLRAQSLIRAGSNDHPSGRYTVEIVTPRGMVKA